MRDPFGSLQNFNTQFRSFVQNPMGYFTSHHLNIPQDLQNNPQGAIQYLLNTGRMSQAQLSQLQQVAQRIQNMDGFLK